MEDKQCKNEELLSLIKQNLSYHVTNQLLTETLRHFPTFHQLHELASGLDAKLQNECKKIVEEQEKINSLLCSENIIAKWVWNSGTLKGGNLVAWDRLTVNTLPENYKWKKGEPQLLVDQAGFYQL